MYSGGLLLDLSSSSIVFSVCFFACLLEWGELDRPDDLFDCLEEVWVLLASPERVNYILNTDAALFAQQLLDEHIVRDGHSLRVFALQVASLANHFVQDFLAWRAPCHVVLHQEQLLEGVP